MEWLFLIFLLVYFLRLLSVSDSYLPSFFFQYKSSPCKKVCVTGWMVVLPDDPARPNIFHLNDPDKGQPQQKRNLRILLFVSKPRFQ